MEQTTDPDFENLAVGLALAGASNDREAMIDVVSPIMDGPLPTLTLGLLINDLSALAGTLLAALAEVSGKTPDQLAAEFCDFKARRASGN